MIYRFKIDGLPTQREFSNMNLGERLHQGMDKGFQLFKFRTNSIWLSQKRKSYHKAISEAIALYGVDEYFCRFNSSPDYFDDTFEFWYSLA